MEWLKSTLGYSASEMELIRYGFSVITMEASKFLIMLLLFILLDKPLEYLFSAFILVLLRTNAGGLHFPSYLSCLLFSIFFFCASCILLPHSIPISDIGMLVSLFCCIVITYLIGPVVSKERPVPTAKQAKRGKIETFKIIFFYFIIVFLFSKNNLLIVGFWTIILQTIQLIIACLLRKEKFK